MSPHRAGPESIVDLSQTVKVTPAAFALALISFFSTGVTRKQIAVPFCSPRSIFGRPRPRFGFSFMPSR